MQKPTFVEGLACVLIICALQVLFWALDTWI